MFYFSSFVSVFKVKIFKQINKENKNYVNNVDFYEK